MNVGMVGAGKLGLPVALAIESKGHDVTIYDVNPAVEQFVREKHIPYTEKDLPPLLEGTNIKVAKSIGEVVANSELIFLAVQTPHDPKYEGTTRIPEDRKDFNYDYLEVSVSAVAKACEKLKEKKTVAVISTCLPGTYNERIKPLTNEYTDYVYTPQFIAMGTVLDDYLNPEFNLIGVEEAAAADKLEEFYKTINSAPALRTDITTAEAIKVSYNTFITMKTVLANTWGEIAEKVGANVDDIFQAWTMSYKRLLSEKYLRAGMSDGGSCHPRDNIALSYIAEKINLSHNIFEDLMKTREDTEGWHADVAHEASRESKLPLVLLGRSFKPETNIETGSPAILMSNLLKEKGVLHQHYEDLEGLPQKATYFIATQHKRYKDYKFPKGSIVIDPFGIIADQPGVTVRRLGRK